MVDAICRFLRYDLLDLFKAGSDGCRGCLCFWSKEPKFKCKYEPRPIICAGPPRKIRKSDLECDNDDDNECRVVNECKCDKEDEAIEREYCESPYLNEYKEYCERGLRKIEEFCRCNRKQIKRKNKCNNEAEERSSKCNRKRNKGKNKCKNEVEVECCKCGDKKEEMKCDAGDEDIYCRCRDEKRAKNDRDETECDDDEEDDDQDKAGFCFCEYVRKPKTKIAEEEEEEPQCDDGDENIYCRCQNDEKRTKNIREKKQCDDKDDGQESKSCNCEDDMKFGAEINCNDYVDDCEDEKEYCGCEDYINESKNKNCKQNIGCDDYTQKIEDFGETCNNRIQLIVNYLRRKFFGRKNPLPSLTPELKCIEQRAMQLWGMLYVCKDDSEAISEESIKCQWENLPSCKKLPIYWMALSEDYPDESPFENFKNFYTQKLTAAKVKCSKEKQEEKMLMIWHGLELRQRLPFIMEALIAKIAAGAVNVHDNCDVKHMVSKLQKC